MNVTATTDIVVAGAGPAGSRVAELLSKRGATVLLLDPKAPWEKPCGGGLTAAALRHTPELNELRPDGELVRQMEIIAPSGSRIVLPLRSPYLVVSRLKLSSWGIERAIAAGARFHSAGVHGASQEANGWLVTDSLGERHRCRWLVAADGSASTLRRLLAPSLLPGRYAARVAYAPRGAPPGRAVLRFLPSTEGYAWDFPRRGLHSIGVAVPAGSCRRPELDRVIAELRAMEGAAEPAPHYGAMMAAWDWTSGSFPDLGGFDHALLGDAAGLADPVSGEGMDYALRSAALAATAFAEGTGFQRYPAAVFREFAPDRRRAQAVRRWFYRPRIIERLVRDARHSPRAASLLASLVNAANEHEPIGAIVRRELLSRLGGRSIRTTGVNRP